MEELQRELLRPGLPRAADVSEGFVSLNRAIGPTVAACQRNAIVTEMAEGNLALRHDVAGHTAAPAAHRP